MSRRAALLLALALLVLGAAAAPSQAADGLALRAGAREPGRITLRVEARAGVELTVRDDLTGAQRTLVPKTAVTILRRFATWSCEATARSFSAAQAGEDGSPRTATAEVRTPTCAHRLVLAGPRSVRAPRRAPLHLRDRWRLGGVDAELCVRPPGAGRRCRSLRVQPGRRERSTRIRALRPGGYRITATTPHQRLRRTLRATPPSGRLRILATGDSMIQIVDSYLKQRVGSGPARVRSDARISTGLSKPSLLDWDAHARRQAARMRPDAVVMFIGANDGFPMAGNDCCEPAWVTQYARRARRMMRTYARGSRARVYWLLLPAPRSGFFREVFPAVNAGLRAAARGLEDDVRLVDLEAVFTPGGRYRDSIRIGGRLVRVRQADGVHLNAAGASLAATLIIRALRRDRMLP